MNHFFIVTDNILFLYKLCLNKNSEINLEFFKEINKFNTKLYLLNIFELNNNHFLLLCEEGVLIIEYYKNENKIQVKNNYIDDEYKKYAFGLNSKKLKFKNEIKDFIIFKYNNITFINYITFKKQKTLLNEKCNLPERIKPNYCIIDNNKNLVGFNSYYFYYFIIDIYNREIPYKFSYPGTLYYSIYSMEKLSYNKFICFYYLKGCYSSEYMVSFCSLFKDGIIFDHMFQFQNKFISIPNIKIICTTSNNQKNYIFCQPYHMKILYLICLKYQ